MYANYHPYSAFYPFQPIYFPFPQPPPPWMYPWAQQRRCARARSPPPGPGALPKGQVIFEELEEEEMEWEGQPDVPEQGNNIEPEEHSDAEGGWEPQEEVESSQGGETEPEEGDEPEREISSVDEWDEGPRGVEEPIPEMEIEAADGMEVHWDAWQLARTLDPIPEDSTEEVSSEEESSGEETEVTSEGETDVISEDEWGALETEVSTDDEGGEEPREVVEPILEDEIGAEEGDPGVPEEGNNFEPQECSNEEGDPEPVPALCTFRGLRGGTSIRTKRRLPSNDGSQRKLRRR